MISFEQCKHVITYYIHKIITKEPMHITPPILRDCIFWNKQRGEICANISSRDKLSEIIGLLHDADRIEQMNSIPNNNKCFIDNKYIPKNNSGIQLLIYKDNEIKHICIQKKYQKICYAYFKIKNFPEFIEKHIKDWLIEQDWYIPGTYNINFITDKILSSQIPQAIHIHLTQGIEILTNEDI